MANLERRIEALEQVSDVNLRAMTDAELRARSAKFPMFSKEGLAAIITLIWRRPSTLSVVRVLPDDEEGTP